MRKAGVLTLSQMRAKQEDELEIEEEKLRRALASAPPDLDEQDISSTDVDQDLTPCSNRW